MMDPASHSVEHRQFDPRHISERNARYGWILFLIYLACYALFVVLNTFWPEAMDLVPAAGVNLAIWYGLGLIALALILAAIYAWLCRSRVSQPAAGGDGR